MLLSPGEQLPEFPPFTHSRNGSNGLKPFKTPKSLLTQVSKHAPNHDIAAAHNRSVNYKTWDWNLITATITCNGGENCSHPSGDRALTHRELAALQGFPENHVFYAGDRRRQIGNAVPPVIGKVLLSWIRRHLEKVDGIVHHVDAVIE